MVSAPIDLKPQPLDPVHVRALDADQLGRRPAAGRMQIALVVEPGHARRQRVRANRARLARLLPGSRVDELVVGRLGLALRLPIDRPRWAMVVRRRVFRSGVRVREDAETQFRVFVEDLAFRRLVREMHGKKLLVAKQRFHPMADPAPPARSRILLQDVVAFPRELRQRSGHGPAPYLRLSVQSNPAYCSLTRPRRRSTRSTAASSSSRVSTNSSTPRSPPKSSAYQRSRRGMTSAAPPASMRTEWRTYQIEASSNWTSSCPPSNTRSGGDERPAFPRGRQRGVIARRAVGVEMRRLHGLQRLRQLPVLAGHVFLSQYNTFKGAQGAALRQL